MRGFYFITICSFFVLMTCGMTACNYNVQKQTPGGGSNKVISADAPINSKLIQSGVLNTCLNCHAGTNKPNLNTKSDIQQAMDKLIPSVMENKMPPASQGFDPLTDCQKALLKKWVDMGMPEHSDEKTGSLPACKGQDPNRVVDTTPIEQMPLTYQTFLKKILQPRCLQCHNEKDKSDASRVLFFPFAKIKERAGWFNKKGHDSKLYKVVVREDEDRMPPPDSNVPALTKQEAEFIANWIDMGSPEK